MNKKFLAILMTLAMIISLVPMAAMAEEPQCDHEGGAWIPNGDGTHTSSCDCGEYTVTGDCQNINGHCYMCGYDMSPKCDHEGGAWIPNGDGTHTSSCDCGEYTVTGDCQNINGHCYMCGYDMSHECDYNAGITSNKDGTHNINCSCGKFVTVKCLDNDGDGKCDSCGYQKYAPECKHAWKGVVNNGDATHNVVCRDCLEVLDVESHKFVDGRPCDCGAIYIHDHDWNAGVTSNEDGTHKINCSCGAFVTVNCLDNDGDNNCDSCGYVKYDHDCTYEAGVTSNGNGTHNVNCSCGKYVTIDCLDPDGDGKCDSCGYQKYTTECKHGFMAVKDNGDGKTHKVTCRDCGEILTKQAEHKFSAYGVCACGAIESTGCDHDGAQKVIDNCDGETHKVICEECGEVIAENDEHTYSTTTGTCACGAQKPATSTPADDSNLDDVPKTGDNGIVLALGSILLVSIMGSAVLFLTGKKKYI